MQVELIKKDAAINFADVFPDINEILEDAVDKIMKHENVMDGYNPEDFKVHFGSDEPTNNFAGAFIATPFGSYLLHDIREEQIKWYVEDPNLYTVVFYSLSKISDNGKR
jgi:hypothetical protein